MERTKIIELIEEGEDIETVAKATGTMPDVVREILRKERIDKVIMLLKRGVSLNKIAEETRMSKSNVRELKGKWELLCGGKRNEEPKRKV